VRGRKGGCPSRRSAPKRGLRIRAIAVQATPVVTRGQRKGSVVVPGPVVGVGTAPVRVRTAWTSAPVGGDSSSGTQARVRAFPIRPFAMTAVLAVRVGLVTLGRVLTVRNYRWVLPTASVHGHSSGNVKCHVCAVVLPELSER
jgi:hypothetical protein